ncbi:hypothetical protein ACHAXT_001850 [Thalassiosira profunda]
MTGDFQSTFHAERCRAARYKVHMPLCDCPKVAGLRQRYVSALADAKRKADGGQRASGTGREAQGADGERQSLGINAYANEIQFDSGESKDPFDNLIVVPDTKSTPAVYVCEDTNRQALRTDGTARERKLAREIFGETENGAVASTDKVAENGDIPPFKVNCAICLLTGHQRNGFVAVASSSFDEMQPTIQRAREAGLQKANGGKGLHSDHAHFVCALEVSTLQSLLAAGKTRSKSQRENGEILRQMKEEGGVELSAELMDAPQSTSVQIKMGHHLTSLLYLLQTPAKRKPKDKDETSGLYQPIRYMMVLGYQDGPAKLELDLPGGKRHLAESTLEGAVREVEEECSLLLDRRWLAERVCTKYGGSLSNSTSRAGAGGVAEKEDGGSWVRVLEPGKVKGSASGDAFFVLAPPPPL